MGETLSRHSNDTGGGGLSENASCGTGTKMDFANCIRRTDRHGRQLRLGELAVGQSCTTARCDGEYR